jgi:5-methyltetrahydropteroyltriglutamate--homocysteine methyltransferase
MIPTEPIGSIPRPDELVAAMAATAAGSMSQAELDALLDAAVLDTIEQMEATGSPIVTDGEQRKPSFATYPVDGLPSLRTGGVAIPFADGHTRQLPVISEGPFRYRTHADAYLRPALAAATRPVKQAVISASALSLLYPADGIDGYSRDAFLADLADEAEADIRRCLDAGAYAVQVDFTEGRLALKLDPSGGLLRSFVDLNNAVLDRFGADERRRIGIHSCPGGDHDSTHSADVGYAELLPLLFDLHAGSFYLELAGEADPGAVLQAIAANARPGQRIFVGVTNPIDPRIESAEEVRDRVLLAAEYIPVDVLGTTDDCGFAPFADDRSTPRETAFAKIRARVEGTALAERELSGG